jgi:hypothetical protein
MFEVQAEDSTQWLKFHSLWQYRETNGMHSMAVCVFFPFPSLYGTEHYSIGRQLCSHSRASQHFMEPEGSSPHSQELSIGSYSEPDQSSPHHRILSLQD